MAVHVHEAADAVTAIEPEPPCLRTSCVFGEIEMVQGGAAVVAVVAVVVVAAVARPETP